MYVYHRDLHVLTPSFPTRRSSDLCPDRAHSGAASKAPGSSSLPLRAGVPRGVPLGAPVTRSSTGSLPPKKTFTLAAAVGSEVGSEVVQSDAPRDRKSTRLNSSH